MFVNAVKLSSRRVNRYIDSAPELVPIGYELNENNDDNEDAVFSYENNSLENKLETETVLFRNKYKKKKKKKGRRVMPELVPLDLSDDEIDEEEDLFDEEEEYSNSLGWKNKSGAIDASSLLQEIGDKDVVLSYKHRKKSVPQKNVPQFFADSESEDEDDFSDNSQALKEHEWNGENEYTEEELALLQYMPKLEPIGAVNSGVFKKMPALELISTEEENVKHVGRKMPALELISLDDNEEEEEEVKHVGNKMPALEPISDQSFSLDSSVLEVAARVKNLSLEEDDSESLELPNLNNSAYNSNNSRVQQSQDISESFVAATGMNFQEYMNYDAQRIEKKRVADELFGTVQEKSDDKFSSSAKDYDNFERHFDTYMEMLSPKEKHMDKGAVVLAPTSKVYTERLYRGVEKKFSNPEEFKRFMELYIILPGENQKGPTLIIDEKTNRTIMKNMHGHKFVIQNDPVTNKKTLMGQKKPKLLDTQKSKKHENIYFLGHSNLFTTS